MVHESLKDNELLIEDTDLTFEEVYEKPYTPKEYMEEIKQANVLMIPEEGYRDNPDNFFPECADEILNYLKDNESEGLKVEICADDENFNKLELHADVIIIGTFILQKIVLPLLATVIVNYLKSKLAMANKSAKDTNTQVKLIVEEDGKAKKITYEGSVENFEKTMQTLEATLFKQEK